MNEIGYTVKILHWSTSEPNGTGHKISIMWFKLSFRGFFFRFFLNSNLRIFCRHILHLILQVPFFNSSNNSFS